MRDDYRGATVCHTPGHRGHELCGVVVILPERRFIKHQDVRVGQKCPGDRKTPFLPVTESKGVGACQTLKVGAPERVIDPLRHCVRIQLFHAHGCFQIGPDGLSDELVFRVLEDIPEPATLVYAGYLFKRSAIQQDRPSRRLHDTRKDQSKGALARAVRPHDCDQFSGSTGQRDTGNRISTRPGMPK